MQLELRNVSKSFDNDGADVLNNVNLTIKSGEFVSVVGKSGCGKSTLLNLIAGLIKPSYGEILLNGKEVLDPGADRTVMFQEHALFPWLNVYDNVCFGMNLQGIDKETIKNRADKYISLVQLSGYEKYKPHELSGGMRQRVALARALSMESEILLMDEPFSALDKQTANHLRKELQSIWLKTKRTVVFITHSVEEAIYLGDKVVVMSPKTKGIEDIIDISLKRPRAVYDEEFVKYRHKILDMVGGKDNE